MVDEENIFCTVQTGSPHPSRSRATRDVCVANSRCRIATTTTILPKGEARKAQYRPTPEGVGLEGGALLPPLPRDRFFPIYNPSVTVFTVPPPFAQGRQKKFVLPPEGGG